MQTSKELALARWPESAVRVAPIRRQKELNLGDVRTLLQRRRKVVIVTVLSFFCVGALLSIVSTRRYQAEGQIEVQKEATNALGLESMMGEADGASDALDASLNIQTEANILQSESLALRVISDLKLEQNSDFKSKFNPVGWVLGLFSSPSVPDPKGASLRNSPLRRSRLLKVFSKNLKVKPVSGTRLIAISYLNPDPNTAAAVVNRLSQALADYDFQTRFNATSQAADWLSGQLAGLRKESEDLQAKVVQLQRDSGVFTLGETDMQGREQVYSTVLDRLEQSTAQLTQAESNRVIKGALYQVVKSGNAETISGLAGNTVLGASGSPGVTSSLTLIQNLRAQEATLQGQISGLAAKFGPAYPRLGELRANLQTLQQSIATEIDRVAQRARRDYEVAQHVEDSTRNIFNDEKQKADTLNNKTIEYTIARQEAADSRSLYESLLKKLKEAGVLAGLRSSNITIVDPALVPAKPAKPNVLLYLGGSLVAGLLAGLCGAFMKDAMDRKIQNLPELEAYLGETPLGVLPYHKEARSELKELASESTPAAVAKRLADGAAITGFPVISEPRSPYTEAVRALRTSLLLSKGGAAPKVILVTSSVPGEGKSMLSANLAALFAQQGKKVLLVDADLRRPVLHRRLNVRSEVGLSSILSREGVEDTAVSAPLVSSQIPGMEVLPAGPPPPYPSELLGSEQMKSAVAAWRAHYDFVVIDGAPVLPVTDSVLLSSLTDLTLLVARYKLTERQSLERSYRLLQSGAERQQVGVVLNGVERKAHTYFDYYGYDDNSYYTSQRECVNA